MLREKCLCASKKEKKNNEGNINIQKLAYKRLATNLKLTRNS